MVAHLGIPAVRGVSEVVRRLGGAGGDADGAGVALYLASGEAKGEVFTADVGRYSGCGIGGAFWSAGPGGGGREAWE